MGSVGSWENFQEILQLRYRVGFFLPPSYKMIKDRNWTFHWEMEPQALQLSLCQGPASSASQFPRNWDIKENVLTRRRKPPRPHWPQWSPGYSTGHGSRSQGGVTAPSRSSLEETRERKSFNKTNTKSTLLDVQRNVRDQMTLHKLFSRASRRPGNS